MALSTLRLAMRPALLSSQCSLVRASFPMATSAHDQMKQFWKKNQELGRPVAPWIIYKPHVPMITSLTHRVTGIVMGVGLYSIAIGLFLAPGDMASHIAALQSLSLASPIIMFPAKTIVAFPLIYHYINGIRHLYWDFKGGYELGTQYKTGYFVFSLAIALAALAGSAAYWM